jgi:hypothetical protein
MIDSLEVTIIEPAVSCNEKFDEVFVTISDQSVRGEKTCVAFTPLPKMASLVELTEGVVTEPRLVSPALFKAAVLAIVNG